MPEAHGRLWNSWLLNLTIVWMGLAGRHALWFDGITNGVPAAVGCPLCGIQPNACADLLLAGVTLHIGPRHFTRKLSPAANRLSGRCRAEHPRVWPLLHTELDAFEALHGPWRGDVDNSWTVLRHTYVGAVLASLNGGSKQDARDIQVGSGAVGADQFPEPISGRGGGHCAAVLHVWLRAPHFLWNCLSHQNTTVSGDWLDG